MIQILKKMFEANPEKSKIVLNDKCFDCGCETIIEITPTSGGFGLQGGILFKRSPDGYLIKCLACCQANPRTDNHQKSGKKFIKILLVENELKSRRILNLFLDPFGELDIAVNGKDALTAVKKAIENNHPYELIFLDSMVPEHDGILTLKKIRQLEALHGMNGDNRSKIIVTSSSTERDIILKAFQADCTAYIIKPIDKTRLYNEMRKHGFSIPEPN
jgi:two-component system, chemotaxis family, chemotaxis protein CheY